MKLQRDKPRSTEPLCMLIAMHVLSTVLTQAILLSVRTHTKTEVTF